MKFYFLFLCVILFNSLLQAQTQVWLRTDTIGGIHSAKNIVIDSNANVYAAGPAYNGNNAPYTSLVFKLDSSGNYEWYQIGVNSLSIDFEGMTGDNTGNTYMFGEYFHSGPFSAYLAKTDSSGKQDWDELYDNANNYDNIIDAIVDNQGNILATSTTSNAKGQGMETLKFSPADSTPTFRAFYFDPDAVQYNSYFIKGDNAGGIYNIGQVWYGTYANNIVVVKYNSAGGLTTAPVISAYYYSDEEPASANVDTAGNLYIADNSYYANTNSNGVPFLMKMNKSGIMTWKTLFKDTLNDYLLNTSVLDPAGNFYVAGSRNDSMFFAKLSGSTGDTLWTFAYPDSGYINKIIFKNGAIYATGVSTSNNAAGIITIKLGANGNALWNVIYNDSLNGSDQAFDLVADNSYNIYVAGESLQAVGSAGSATVIKYHDDCTLTIDSFFNVNASTNKSSDGSAIAITSGGTQPFGYTWSDGDSTDTITDLSANLYCLTVSDTRGCVAILCDSIRPNSIACTLVIDSVKVNNVYPCYNGANAAITVYASGGIGQVMYSIDNGIDYSTTNFFGKLPIGVHNIVVKDSLNCQALYAGNPVTITQPQPDTPSIRYSGDSLSTSVFSKYYWYHAGNIVDTSQVYVTSDTVCGYIYVQIVDSNGCYATSDSIDLICMGINALNNPAIGLTIYPNPFSNYFTVQIDAIQNGEIQADLFDLYGQRIYSNRNFGNSFSINTGALPSGIYLFQLKAGDQFLYKQIIKGN